MAYKMMGQTATSAILAALLASAPVSGFAQDTKPAENQPTQTQTAEAPAEEAKPAEAPAQADAAQEKAPADAANQAPAAAPSAVPMPGIATSAENAQLGQPYIKQTFDDWQLRCLKTDTGADPCELFQELKNSQGSPISQVTFSTIESKDIVAVASVMMPLETDLLQGMTMQIDSGKEQRIPFATCVPQGCLARIAMTDNDLNLFKKGGKATLTVQPFMAPPEAKENVTLSLKGFTAGMDAAAASYKEAMKAMAEAQKATQAQKDGAPKK